MVKLRTKQRTRSPTGAGVAFLENSVYIKVMLLTLFVFICGHFTGHWKMVQDTGQFFVTSALQVIGTPVSTHKLSGSLPHQIIAHLLQQPTNPPANFQNLLRQLVAFLLGIITKP